jgi:Ca2+-dependent lipid-binding protein
MIFVYQKTSPSGSIQSIPSLQQTTPVKTKSTNSIASIFKSKKQRKCVLNVVLIEANNLISKDKNGLSDPYVKFRLENEEYRSKTIRKDLNPKYNEQFQFYIYENDSMNLYIRVYDLDPIGNDDDFMGM